MRRYLRDVIGFIWRMWAYTPVLWRDRDWDFVFIYRLLAFKLKRVERALVNGCAIHEKESLQSLRLCIVLADRLSSYDYLRHATMAWTIKEYRRADGIENRDRRWLFAIMAKYMNHWWD